MPPRSRRASRRPWSVDYGARVPEGSTREGFFSIAVLVIGGIVCHHFGRTIAAAVALAGTPNRLGVQHHWRLTTHGELKRSSLLGESGDGLNKAFPLGRRTQLRPAIVDSSLCEWLAAPGTSEGTAWLSQKRLNRETSLHAHGVVAGRRRASSRSAFSRFLREEKAAAARSPPRSGGGAARAPRAIDSIVGNPCDQKRAASVRTRPG